MDAMSDLEDSALVIVEAERDVKAVSKRCDKLSESIQEEITRLKDLQRRLGANMLSIKSDVPLCSWVHCLWNVIILVRDIITIGLE